VLWAKALQTFRVEKSELVVEKQMKRLCFSLGVVLELLSDDYSGFHGECLLSIPTDVNSETSTSTETFKGTSSALTSKLAKDAAVKECILAVKNCDYLDPEVISELFPLECKFVISSFSNVLTSSEALEAFSEYISSLKYYFKCCMYPCSGSGSIPSTMIAGFMELVASLMRASVMSESKSFASHVDIFLEAIPPIYFDPNFEISLQNFQTWISKFSAILDGLVFSSRTPAMALSVEEIIYKLVSRVSVVSVVSTSYSCLDCPETLSWLNRIRYALGIFIRQRTLVALEMVSEIRSCLETYTSNSTHTLSSYCIINASKSVIKPRFGLSILEFAIDPNSQKIEPSPVMKSDLLFLEIIDPEMHNVNELNSFLALVHSDTFADPTKFKAVTDVLALPVLGGDEQLSFRATRIHHTKDYENRCAGLIHCVKVMSGLWTDADSLHFNLIDTFLHPEMFHPTPMVDPVDVPEINSSYKQAISYALRDTLSIIRAPPGTGSLQLVASLTQEFLNRSSSLRILVLTPSDTHCKALFSHLNSHDFAVSSGLTILDKSSSIFDFNFRRSVIHEYEEFALWEKIVCSATSLDVLDPVLSSWFDVKRIKEDLSQLVLDTCSLLVVSRECFGYHEFLIDRKFDVVIVEMAQQFCDTDILSAISHKSEKLVLIGDHFRAGPRASSRLVGPAVKSSIFSRLASLSETMCLSIQSRFLPLLYEWINFAYYRDRLATSECSSVPLLPDGFPWPSKEDSVALVSIPRVNSTSVRHEVSIALQIVDRLLKGEMLSSHDMIILVPHQDQRSYIVDLDPSIVVLSFDACERQYSRRRLAIVLNLFEDIHCPAAASVRLDSALTLSALTQGTDSLIVIGDCFQSQERCMWDSWVQLCETKSLTVSWVV
jgi:hypothetical protein